MQNLRISGENCLIFDWHSSRAAPGILFFRVPTKDHDYKLEKQHCYNGCSYFSWCSYEGNIKRQIKNRTFWAALSSRKKWSVISKLFLLNCIFPCISNWSQVLEFYLTSFFNMKSWRVKFRNFLGNLPVHYATLFVNRTTSIWLY